MSSNSDPCSSTKTAVVASVDITTIITTDVIAETGGAVSGLLCTCSVITKDASMKKKSSGTS